MNISYKYLKPYCLGTYVDQAVTMNVENWEWYAARGHCFICNIWYC